MNRFENIADLIISLANFTEIIDDLRSKGLHHSVDFDFDLIAVTTYDDFNIPLTDHVRFSFKDGKWVTYVILKYG